VVSVSSAPVGKVGLEFNAYKRNHKYQQETLQWSASERRRCMPKAAAIHCVNVCHSAKSRSRSGKKNKDCSGCLRSAVLPNMIVLAQVIDVVLEPKSGSKRFDLFAKVKVTYANLACIRPFRAECLCTTLL